MSQDTASISASGAFTFPVNERTATDHPATASTGIWEKQAAMLRADLKVLQSFVDDLDEGEAVKAFYNVRAAVIAYLHECSPAEQPAPATGGELDVEAEPEPTKVEITREGRMFWHTNCPKNRFKSGIMRVVSNEPTRSLIQCGHCNKYGYYPVGGAGTVCSYEVVAPSNNSPVGGKESKA